MKTESVISTRIVDKASLQVIRVVDFEALAKAQPDGRISFNELESAGDFFVSIVPKGRNAKATRVGVFDAGFAVAFCDGFETAAALGARPVKSAADKAAAKKARADKKAAAAAGAAKAPAKK